MLHTLLSKSNNWNKSKNSSEENIDFLLQNQWNNFFLKNVDGNHSFIAQMFEEEVNSLLKKTKERQPSKKITNSSRRLIFKFFSIKDIL